MSNAQRKSAVDSIESTLNDMATYVSTIGLGARPAQSRDEFLAERRNIIGGSDAAVACGVSKYEHMIELWSDKRGLDVERKVEPISGYRPMYWGSSLEENLCRYYEERTGLRVYRGELCADGLFRLPLLVHPKYPWMAAHLDGLAIDPNGDVVEVLECKTAGYWMKDNWGEEGTDDIPREYLIQCSHNLEVARQFFPGVERAAVPVLIAGQEDRLYRVHYDADFVADILALERDFWEKVTSGQEPDIDSSEASKRYLDRRYPEHCESEVFADDDTDTVVHRLKEARDRLAVAEEEKRGCENEIKRFMGEAGVLTSSSLDPTGKPTYKITWKQTKDRQDTDWEAVARGLGNLFGITAFEAQVQEHTKLVPGSRRFVPTGPLFPKRSHKDV